MTSPLHLLTDLDDTLYSYPPALAAAEAATFALAGQSLGLDALRVADELAAARARVKARLGKTAAAHSRLLYFHDMVQALGRVDLLAAARAWDRTYWSTFIENAPLRPGALDLLRAVRARGGKVAIVTDLVLEVQLWKLERMGLAPHIDALAASEEVPEDKPRPEIFALALSRLGVDAKDCVMIGDSESKDGEGARALGIRFLLVDVGDGKGRSLEAIGRELGVLS